MSKTIQSEPDQMDQNKQEPEASTSTSAPDKSKTPKLQDDSIAPAQTNGGQNPFENYRTTKLLGRLGSQEDLAKLKALNDQYYRTLRPIHLKSANKTIIIEHNMDKGDNYTQTRCVRLSTMIENGQTTVDAQNWQPQLAQAFSKLEFSSMLCLDTIVQPFLLLSSQYLSDPAFVSSLTEQVKPHITIIKVHNANVRIPKSRIHFGSTYAEFWNQFPNLKLLQFEYQQVNCELSPSQLSIMLRETRPSIQVELKIVNLGIERNDSNLLRNLDLLPNVKISLYNARVCSDSTETVQEIILFCNRCHVQIEEISMKIFLHEENRETEDAFRNFYLLSTKITKLTMADEINFNLLSGELEWPKLCSLRIDHYSQPLEILKKCPQLEKLKVYMDQIPCIFHNSYRTDEEAVQEYFGNLPKLKKLSFRKRSHWEDEENFKIYARNQLEAFLKTVLPQGVIIEYE